jgi:hypothetical protein
MTFSEMKNFVHAALPKARKLDLSLAKGENDDFVHQQLNGFVTPRNGICISQRGQKTSQGSTPVLAGDRHAQV